MSDIGRKDDQGKPLVGLMVIDFHNAFEELADLHTYGTVKYSPSGWKYVDDAVNRYYNALGRHFIKTGASLDAIDLESRAREIAAVAWNALALMQLTNPDHIPGKKPKK